MRSGKGQVDEILVDSTRFAHGVVLEIQKSSKHVEVLGIILSSYFPTVPPFSSLILRMGVYLLH